MDATDFHNARFRLNPIQQRILARDANDNITYIAYGPKGAATSSGVWIVEKLIYDANADYSYSQHSDINQIADNYLVITYA